MRIGSGRLWAGLLVSLGVVGLVACGGGTAQTPSSAPAATPAGASVAPEAQRTTAAAVAAGLQQIDQIGKDIAATAGTDKAKGTSLAAQIEPAWKPIEGTVKQNSQATYLTMEDNFAVLDKAAENGDAAAAAKGSAAISTAVQAYLAKYPG